MVNLVFGVIDVPYDNGTKAPRKGKGKRRGKTNEPTTTVKVATILEDKYGVMATFYDAHKDDIMRDMIESAEGALETLFMGGPVVQPFAEAGSKIDAAFKTFLLTAEIENMGIPGVPTQAAIDRRSLRFKSKVGPSKRPSFIDTGTYELSFRSWVE